MESKGDTPTIPDLQDQLTGLNPGSNCEICLRSVPVEPVATSCGHIFCYPCIQVCCVMVFTFRVNNRPPQIYFLNRYFLAHYHWKVGVHLIIQTIIRKLARLLVMP